MQSIRLLCVVFLIKGAIVLILEMWERRFLCRIWD